MYLTAMTL